MPAIRALFMDLDNTLADDSGSLRQSLSAAFPVISHRLPSLSEENFYQAFRTVNNRHWENYDESPIASMTHSVEVRTFIALELLTELNCPDAELARQLAIQFQMARRKNYACYEDTLPVLQSLKNRIPLVLVTNGNAEMQRDKIVRCQLDRWMDRIFIAQEVGISKPSPEIFQMALASVNAAPHESLMVGDHYEKDILGAKSAGMQTAWIRRGDREATILGEQPDYIVRSMREIHDMIEQEILSQ